jgi:sulfonate transport system substrate-binding protein
MLVAAGFVLLLLAAVLLWLPAIAGSRSQGTAVGPAPQLTLGVARQPGSALLLLALDAGLAAAEGLDVRTTDFVSGKRALQALLAGEVEVVTTGETPLVLEAFRRHDLRILASISSSDNEPRIAARRDRGIEAPADLRGKTISTQKGSSVHFFLHLFLLKHRLTTNEVRVVFHRPEDLAAALVAGDVDAISMREPIIGEAGRALPGQVTVLAEPGLYLRHELLVTTETVLATKPEAVRRLLATLLESERRARRRSADAIACLGQALHLEPSTAAALWRDEEARVQLTQSLLLSLEDETRWAQSSGLVGPGPLPNILSLFHTKTLGALEPERVTILGARP